MNIYFSLLLAGAASIFAIAYWLPKKLISTYLSSYGILYKIELNYPLNEKKPIAITIDDAPYGYDSLNNILDVLDKHNCKVTFFVISSFINDKNQNLLMRAIKSGHQLANHGKTDTIHARLSYETLSEEISDCNEKLKEIYEKAGVKFPKNCFYRPGSGFLSKNMKKLSKDMTFTITLGTTYPHDPTVRSSKINFNYLITKVEPDDIVILHDRPWTPKLLDQFLGWLNENNYHCYTLTQATEDSMDNRYSDDTLDTDDSEISCDSEDETASPELNKKLEELAENFKQVAENN